MKILEDEAVLYRIGTFVFLILAFAIIGYCQESKPVNAQTHIDLHRGQKNMEYEDALRVRVAKLTSKDDRLLYLRKDSRFGIELFSFGYDKSSHLPKLETDKCYFFLWCIEHKFAVHGLLVDCKYN